MAAQTLAQTAIHKDGRRTVMNDAGAAISLFFKRGPAKIKTLETLAESMRIRAQSSQSEARRFEESRSDFYKYHLYRAHSAWSFRLVSRVHEKIGKIRRRMGDYRGASDAYYKARAFGEGVQSSRRERWLFGMECYYKGKQEATASVEKSIFADVHPNITRTGMDSFAAAVMEQAFRAFIEAEEIEMAMKVGKEAAELFFKADRPRDAVDTCVKLAELAKQSYDYLAAWHFYKKAADYSSGRRAKNSFLLLAEESRRVYLIQINAQINATMQPSLA